MHKVHEVGVIDCIETGTGNSMTHLKIRDTPVVRMDRRTAEYEIKLTAYQAGC